MLKKLGVLVMLLAITSTASAESTRLESSRLASYETWYVWQCVNCYDGIETNYNHPPSKYTGAGANMCPYDKINGHVWRCINTKRIVKN